MEGNLVERVGLGLGLGDPLEAIVTTPAPNGVDQMSSLFGCFTREDIAGAVATHVAPHVTAATIDALRYLDAMRAGPDPLVEIAVVSDANALFIEEVFHQIIKIPSPTIYSPKGFIDLRETPEGPQKCPDTGFMFHSKLAWQSPNAHPHKSAIVQQALSASKLRDPTIIYVGAGASDSCPMQRILRLRDHMFWRVGFGLEKFLLNNEAEGENGEGKGVCAHHSWGTGADLLALCETVVGDPSLRLPPRAMIGDEGGEPSEFRTNYVTNMMRGIIGRIIATYTANGDEAGPPASANHEEVVALLRQLCDDLAAEREGVLSDPNGLTQRTDLLPIPSSLLACGTTWRALPWVDGCNYLHLLLWTIVWRYGSPAPARSLGGDTLSSSSEDGAAWLTVDAIRGFAFPRPNLSKIDGTTLGAEEPVYDCFSEEKENVTTSFFASHIKPMILQLETFLARCSTVPLADTSAVKAELHRLLSACVWGNTVDLSMFNRAELGEMSTQAGSPTAGHAADHHLLDKKVVANDMAAAAEYLLGRLQHYTGNAKATESKDGPAAVDIVMDNMGVECAADMVFGLALTTLCPALTVRYHTKPIPFCVSDVMPKDIEAMLVCWESDEATAAAAKRFRAALSSGAIEVHTHPYWVHPSEFREMPPSLVNAYFFTKLFRPSASNARGVVEEHIVPKSDLVVFKGDVNFRRLCGDRHWTPAMFYLGSLPSGTNVPPNDRGVPFKEVAAFWPHAAVPLLALRTNKSEVCVGPSLEAMQRLDEETKRAWRCNGRYAVACFAK